jgi:ubiquitin-protein ligase
MKELNDLKKLNDPTMTIFANENDILIWYAYLFGPEDTPYSEGIFKVY